MSEKYFYNCEGQETEVSKEVFEALTKSDNKMRYFEKDLKQEKTVRKNDGTVILKPSREDSLERLADNYVQFTDHSMNVEDTVIGICMIEKLRDCIPLLSKEEQELISALCFEGKSERKWSAETGIPQKTINDRRRKILSKLKKFMENKK